jgi:hypothetical protein
MIRMGNVMNWVSALKAFCVVMILGLDFFTLVRLLEMMGAHLINGETAGWAGGFIFLLSLVGIIAVSGEASIEVK